MIMMISIWNLLWIVPLSAFAGIGLVALCGAESQRDGKE